MTMCAASAPAPLRCPTLAEVTASLLALLPLGRAWQSNEGGPIPPIVQGFDADGFDPEAFQTRAREGSTLYKFWRAIAEVLTFVNQRFCDLRLEFWCATHTETHELWMQEYGLPDACDPFPDLCTKVAAIGGARCEYYQFIAERAGWSLTCEDRANTCGSRAGDRRSLAGRMRSGASRASEIVIVVDLGQSRAYQAPPNPRPLAGRFLAGQRAGCGPDLTPLQCILGRVIHADLKVTYEAING